MKPSIGRIVHYTNLGDRDGKYPPEIQAALIASVKGRDDAAALHEESSYVVSLHIFYKTGQFDRDDVPFTTAAAGTDEARGRWTWPARGAA